MSKPWTESVMTPARRALMERLVKQATPIKVKLSLRPPARNEK